MKVVWTIAGFDPSGGAGITADLMTFAAHGLFGCSAITAMTVQSTTGVAGVEPCAPEVLLGTLRHLAADLPPVGLKIGMLGTPEIALAVADFVREAREAGWLAGGGPVVLDPVLRSSSGRELYPLDGLGLLREHLLPCVDWLTPNWSELAVVSGMAVGSSGDVDRAAGALRGQYPRLNVVVTGGELAVPVDVLFTADGQRVEIAGEHVATSSTHGTGCAFSSALLARLVAGAGPVDAVREAKAYVAGALRHAPGLGGGRGPMDLLWPLRHAAGDRTRQ